jgi:uncharacterized protein (DUF488 family)
MNYIQSALLVLTVGHSTRRMEDFIGLLQANGVARVVDVRTIPRSRHNPQFNAESLPASLKTAGISYVHLPGLGGLRHASRASPNTGWRNASFRGFADYMQTPEFNKALEQLIRLAGEGQVILMCAEAVPWRCHRSLIADALVARGLRVEHILSATGRQLHDLTGFARIQGDLILYPPEAVSKEADKNAAGRVKARKSLKGRSSREEPGQQPLLE